MEWISVDERLPDESKHGERFLVYDHYGMVLAKFFDDQCGATAFDGLHRVVYRPTHWAKVEPPQK